MSETEFQIHSEIDFVFNRISKGRVVRKSNSLFTAKRSRLVEVRMEGDNLLLVAHWFRIGRRILRKLYVCEHGSMEGSLDLGWHHDHKALCREMESYLAGVQSMAPLSCHR